MRHQLFSLKTLIFVLFIFLHANPPNNSSFISVCCSFHHFVLVLTIPLFNFLFSFWYGQALHATSPRLRISCKIPSWPPILWAKSGICMTSATLSDLGGPGTVCQECQPGFEDQVHQ
jgi:hypothetical protein